MGHGDRFLVPYFLFTKSTIWDKEPVPVSHLPVSHLIDRIHGLPG